MMDSRLGLWLVCVCGALCVSARHSTNGNAILFLCFFLSGLMLFIQAVEIRELYCI